MFGYLLGGVLLTLLLGSKAKAQPAARSPAPPSRGGSLSPSAAVLLPGVPYRVIGWLDGATSEDDVATVIAAIQADGVSLVDAIDMPNEGPTRLEYVTTVKAPTEMVLPQVIDWGDLVLRLVTVRPA